jgi:hypothetical protein
MFLWNICNHLPDCVGFEVLTAVFMKSSTFWDVTPCSLLKVNWCFGRICCLHLQGRKISEAKNQQSLLPASCWFLARLILRPWRWRRHVPPKRQFDFQQNTWCYIPEDRTLYLPDMALNVGMINEWLIGNYVEGRGCGLFKGIIMTSAWRNCGKPLTNLSQDSHCPSRDQNWAPLEHKSEVLQPEKVAQLTEWFLGYSVTLFQLQKLIKNQIRW